jgi:30S ribosomal protein S31
MGKGDIKTKRGKIWRGTTGKSRPKKKRATQTAEQAEVKKEEE